MSRKEKLKKERCKKKKIVVLFLLLIFIIAFVISLVRIINWHNCNKENDSIQSKINEKIQKSIENIPEDENVYIAYQNVIQELKTENEDTIAYIRVPNTNIDCIIVKGNDNSFYLKHNFEKNWNISGWVFADYKNKFDGTDKNIILYGHNCKNGSMFGTLKDIFKKEWYENKENHEIALVTEKEISIYQVFSIYTIEAEEYYITTSFNSDAEYKTFLNTLKGRSEYDFGVEVNEDDTILTLSSCTPSGKGRVVLHAKKTVVEQ